MTKIPEIINNKPLLELYQECSLGDNEALAFLLLWSSYCHAVDDFVDTSPVTEHFMEILVKAAGVYSHSFYTKNACFLYPLVVMITNDYADSVLYEKSSIEWQKKVADVIRLAGNQMICMVALLCGGYSHVRNISGKLRQISWMNHHDSDGKGI